MKASKGTIRLLIVGSVVCLLGYVLFDAFFTFRSYWPNGNPRVSATSWPITSFARVFTGRETRWYPDRHLEFEGNHDGHGALDGVQTWYAENGLILDQWTYHHGLPAAGTRISIWPNHMEHEKVTYDDQGRRDGWVTRLSDSGSVMMHWKYIHGVPEDGERSIYYPNGNLQSDSLLKGGLFMKGKIFSPEGRQSFKFSFNKSKTIFRIRGFSRNSDYSSLEEIRREDVDSYMKELKTKSGEE